MTQQHRTSASTSGSDRRVMKVVPSSNSAAQSGKPPVRPTCGEGGEEEGRFQLVRPVQTTERSSRDGRSHCWCPPPAWARVACACMRLHTHHATPNSGVCSPRTHMHGRTPQTDCYPLNPHAIHSSPPGLQCHSHSEWRVRPCLPGTRPPAACCRQHRTRPFGDHGLRSRSEVRRGWKTWDRASRPVVATPANSQQTHT